MDRLRPIILGKRAHVASVLSAADAQARFRLIGAEETAEFKRLRAEGLDPHDAAQVVVANRGAA